MQRQYLKSSFQLQGSVHHLVKKYLIASQISMLLDSGFMKHATCQASMKAVHGTVARYEHVLAQVLAARGLANDVIPIA